MSERQHGQVLRRSGLTLLALLAAVLLLYPTVAHVGHIIVRARPLQVGWLLADVTLVLAPILVPILSWLALRRDPMSRDGATAAALAISCALSVLSFLFVAFFI